MKISLLFVDKEISVEDYDIVVERFNLSDKLNYNILKSSGFTTFLKDWGDIFGR